MNRTIAYIDGFNLYYGLKSKGWRRYYWLNIQQLAQNLLKEDQKLIKTKYFTSHVIPSPHELSKTKRQHSFLEALETLTDIEIIYGHYLRKLQSCKKCNCTWTRNEEKMTDVNIAVELITDAFHDDFDTALLISGDSDLTSPLRKIRRLFPQKRVVIAFPPNRESNYLKKFSNASFIIGRRNIAKSQFPDRVTKQDGFILERPARWR